jgi:hypothetical protein
MTEQPRRFSFDRQGRTMPAKPVRRGARKYCTDLADLILARFYSGQVPAVVIERALREMAKRDGYLVPKPRRSS